MATITDTLPATSHEFADLVAPRPASDADKLTANLEKLTGAIAALVSERDQLVAGDADLQREITDLVAAGKSPAKFRSRQ